MIFCAVYTCRDCSATFWGRHLYMYAYESHLWSSAAAHRALTCGTAAVFVKKCMRPERACCVQGLRKHAGNYAQALHQVPRNNRHLYVHAYQSFLWNSAATHRVKTYGIAGAVAGDLVISSGTACGAFCASTLHLVCSRQCPWQA